MTINTLVDLWAYDPPLVEGRSIVCPNCGQVSKPEDWAETEVHCEICGSHTACRCPHCHECFDHVFGPTFKTI